jgi:KipI family sensor histidine kinase inhibitor
VLRHTMRLSALSDTAVLVEFAEDASARTGAEVRAAMMALDQEVIDGVLDIVPAFTTVAVFYDPVRVRPAQLDRSAYEHVCEWIVRRIGKRRRIGLKQGPLIKIPVCYGGEMGPDFEAVAAHAGLSHEEVVRLHSQTTYTVGAVGFTPGFPYLRGLPVKLHTPRKATPRTRVPLGSVAIGGAQTGIYSCATPGGWNLIGRTPQPLFFPEKQPPTLLQVGDRVRFQRISSEQFATLARAQNASSIRVENGISDAAFEVVRARGLTTIQDLGRIGFQKHGVSVSGAADPWAARVANLLVCNSEDAAVLECTLAGPDLRCEQDCLVALTGAEVEDVPGWQPISVRAGDLISLRRFVRGARAYLAISGGVNVPFVLGSRSTYLAAQLGGMEGRALRAGDRLPIGIAVRELDTSVSWHLAKAVWPPFSTAPTVRVVKGPQWNWFSAESREAFLTAQFRISAQSDRMGVRLEGRTIAREITREMISEPVALGSIQVPPDGQPIVLLADRQTLGGYPKIAAAIAADIPLLAQLEPGNSVRFSEVSLQEAEALHLQQERMFALLRLGIASHFR